jgi:homocysteine S-methyltransferase
MGDFLSALRSRALLADGGVGSYLFELTGRLSEGSHVYDGLNLSNPDLVRGVHAAYLQAGARCITTNTFEASTIGLGASGLAEKMVEINRAGVRLAREAIRDFKAQDRVEGEFFVLGSIGPLAETTAPLAGWREAYAGQMGVLAAEGVDAFLLETFQSVEQARPALEAARGISSGPPVVLHLAIQQRAAPPGSPDDPRRFVAEAAALGVKVAGVNCCAPWDATAFADAVKDAPEVRDGRVLISAMPNAGGLERIGRRFLSRVNPEFMGRLARTLAEKDVRLIGGCCEVHPPHIAEMRNYLQPSRAGGGAGASPSPHGRTPAGPAEKKANGPFSRKLFNGEFAVSVEVMPPRGTGPRVIAEKVEFVRALAASGLADAVDLTDGSRGIALVPPGDFAGVLRDRLGWTSETGDLLEIIPHFSTRDLNAMGLQSRLMGYHAGRVNNVLFITGDPPKMSPTYPRSTGVFDLDSVGMVRYTHSFLNAGLDFGGQPLGRQADPRTHFTIGSGVEPEAVNVPREHEKLQRKIDAGADYIFTQPVFRFEALEAFRRDRVHAPVLVGVMVLMGVEHARRFAQVPGVAVPQEVFDRLGKYERPEDQAKAGVELAVEQAAWVRRNGWAGLYLMSPASHEPVIEVLRGALS